MASGRPSYAAFDQLVFDRSGEIVPVKRIGGSDHYVVAEDGFDYHIASGKVDDAVWSYLRTEFQKVKEEQLPAALEAMGVTDPFTLAAYEAAIDKFGSGDSPAMAPQQKDLLALMGFRIVIDYHGDVLDIEMPSQPIDLDGDGDER